MIWKAHYWACNLWKPEPKNTGWKIVYCSSIYNNQDMEATKMSIIRWMDEKVVHVHNAILDTENNETVPFAAP